MLTKFFSSKKKIRYTYSFSLDMSILNTIKLVYVNKFSKRCREKLCRYGSKVSEKMVLYTMVLSNFGCDTIHHVVDFETSNKTF